MTVVAHVQCIHQVLALVNKNERGPISALGTLCAATLMSIWTCPSGRSTPAGISIPSVVTHRSVLTLHRIHVRSAATAAIVFVFEVKFPYIRIVSFD